MAKQIGIQFTGRIDGFSFYYDSLYGYLVRRAGGVSSKQYFKDARYAAARDASSEFTFVSKAGKLIREALGEFILPVKDGTMVNRLNKELVALKQLDLQNPRGKRKPETMIGDPEANKWLRIFQFNEDAKIYDLVQYRMRASWIRVDAKHRAPTESCFVTLKAAGFPEGATHAGLTLVKTVIDFEGKCFQTSSSRMTIVSKVNPENCSLQIADAAGAILTAGPYRCGLPGSHQGIAIVCLQVLFFEEKDGALVRLKGKVHGMGVLRVASCICWHKPDARASRKRKLRMDVRRKDLVVRAGGSRQHGIVAPGSRQGVDSG